MFLDVNGVRLHALDFGDGPRTLVAVGGWTGSWEVWEEPIAQLTARGWRCIAYDHRGAGESPVDPALITVGAMVDDVTGVLDALGVERCVLAGESQGGAIAQYAAAQSPNRFDGLVLSAPSPTGRSEGGGGFADACRADYPAAVAGFVSACFPEPDSDHVKRWARNILLRAEPEQAARIIDMWRDEVVPNVDPTQIDVPTLILHGTSDAIVPIELSRQLAELLPDAELLEFEGSGHVPTMTRPDEVVEAILRRFA
ncbi:MAG TPA: alpha/beta hydrolase [Gaiellaceae bacterium]|jgi:pimeloyl-ACP methyl ester carboxylesterase|nr:alpha/beta hydrolase [Gaiellaceae bacterium]